MINKTLLRAAAATLLTASSMISFSATAEEDSIVDRVKPVGQLVVLSESKTAEPAADAAETTATADHAGKAVYDSACLACHGSGVLGAPTLGNKEAWAPRISQGNDTLYSHAISGFNTMPAKGGNASLSDDEVKAVVDYMVEQSS